MHQGYKGYEQIIHEKETRLVRKRLKKCSASPKAQGTQIRLK